MKTTVDIADPLFQQAKALAAEQGVTLRELIEAGLARVLAERSAPGEPFRLRDEAFRGGHGLQAEFADAPWEQIRDAAYEGRR